MSGTINTGGGNVIINLRVTGQQQTTTAFAQLQGMLASLRTQANAFELEMRNVDRTLRYMAAGAIVTLTTGLVTLAGELERQTILLQTMEGTIAKANERMDQMVQLARNVPYSLSTISDAFVKMRTAGIDPIINARGEGPLKNLLDAVAAFGGTDQQIQRASVAIQQMAGKGVVSLEELRQQLGEAIPTAIQAMAAGMGISIAELIEKISKGQVAFKDGVNAMLAEFQKNYAGAGQLLNNTFFGSLRQLRTELDTLALSFNRAGGLDVFTAAITMLIEGFRSLNEQLNSATIQSGMESFSNWASTNAGSIAGMLTAFNSFVTILGEMGTAIAGLIGSLPGESIGGGLIGWILAGRAGLVAGVFLGPVADEFVGIISGFASFLGGLMNSAGAIGAAAGEIATYGVIGFLLFGRKGGLLGMLIALADQIVGGFRSMLASIVGYAVETYNYYSTRFSQNFSPLQGSVDAATKAGKDARTEFESAFVGRGKFFGDVNMTPINELFAGSKQQSAESAASVQGFIDKLNALRKTVADNRAEYERRFGNPQAIGGPTQRDITDLENFNKALERASDRLVGSRGLAIEGWARSQRRVADDFQQTIDRMDVARLTALDDGKPGDADVLARNIAKSREQLATFRKTIDDVVASETAKANAAAGRIVDTADAGMQRFQAQLASLNEQIEAFQASSVGGKRSEEAEVQKVEAQYAALERRLATMRIEVARSRGSDDLQAETMRKLEASQLALNAAREKAIDIARRKAAWEQEDAQRTAARGAEDAASRLSRERLGQVPGGEFQAGIEQRREALRSSIRQLDDEIRVMERRVIETGGKDSWANQWIENLRKIREGFQELYAQVGTFAEREKTRSKDLFDDIGKSLESSFARGLETLISGTGKMKDVITGFFNDITRAVSKYLTNMLFQEASAASGAGGTGGMLFSLFGKIAGAVAGGVGGGVGTPAIDAAGAANGPNSFAVMGGDPFRNALGNAFNMGRVQNFAGGGAFTNRVVSGPTLFNIGQMGEAGPEAIMPLTRVGGRLGVVASGAGGGDAYHFNINALDAGSVRDLLYREGGAIVGSLQQRSRLNRGLR